jgi:putative transposase
LSFEVIKWNNIISNRYEKERRKLAKYHLKAANSRKDFAHKTTTKLVKENHIIVLEDLAVKNLIKNKKLSKSFADASLGEIIRQLKYKSKWHDRIFIQVDRFFPSSKTCSSCGGIKKDLKLQHREWICPHCGIKHDRDTNAAKNIKLEGADMIKLNYKRKMAIFIISIKEVL